jgi:hypothetical protein
MIVVVAVAVMVVGIVTAGPLMLVLAPAVVLVGILTVVVTAMTTATLPFAPVTVGMNSHYVEAKDRQNDHPCHKSDQLSAFHGIHDSFPFIFFI